MTDIFQSSCDGSIDLDNPATYWGERFKECDTVRKLDDWARDVLGLSMLYMDFLSPDHRWNHEPQRTRIYGFCFWYAMEWCNHIMDDTEDNRIWYRKFIYRFLDEVENQC